MTTLPNTEPLFTKQIRNPYMHVDLEYHPNRMENSVQILDEWEFPVNADGSRAAGRIKGAVKVALVETGRTTHFDAITEVHTAFAAWYESDRDLPVDAVLTAQTPEDAVEKLLDYRAKPPQSPIPHYPVIPGTAYINRPFRDPKWYDDMPRGNVTFGTLAAIDQPPRQASQQFWAG